ncbi:hypothetical protein J2T57_004200 [Natronocella acetinitrilica]|uniref:Inactive transglutaminase fused to 7 transmembrane helices n=1 Tax=Natronocella acetinitrilica TaxID=414046 RepID=A0AAE3G721_9GAMM|nr:inactive transglutaminase family protein [Natronocella acetinitrilica]MCP1677026.1 hypothetical protein [Natronocella acetinitrilica]
MRNLHLKLLALGLCGLGVAGIWYKVDVLGLPLTADAQTMVWTVEATASLQADAGPTRVQLFIPSNPPGFNVLSEDYISGGFGLTRTGDGTNRRAEWTSRRASGSQTLYYRIQISEDQSGETVIAGPQPTFPEVPEYEEPYGFAAMTLLDNVRQESADIASFAQRLLIRYNAESPDEHVGVLRSFAEGDAEHTRNIIHILAGARIPARPVQVLSLRDQMRRGALESYLEVHNGTEWIAFNPRTGSPGYGDDTLVWHWGDAPLMEISGGRQGQVQFSAARTPRETVAVAQQQAMLGGSLLMDFSLLSLPIHTQNTYRILLLVPIGALVMVFMRNFIGVKTFGTFMPILIALAFRETELLWGIFLFTAIVAIGLLIRFYLENLKLLLVPRLAAVLIVVVVLLAAISILSHKLGLDRGLSVALFPMVILAMTIERMSLVWEEFGPGEAIQQGVGSLGVAILGYLVMFNDELAHLVFMFPEILLIILAVVLLMGRYTGYRLTEIWRFRHLIREQSGK